MASGCNTKGEYPIRISSGAGGSELDLAMLGNLSGFALHSIRKAKLKSNVIKT